MLSVLKQKPLGRRIVALMILANVLLALVATSVQFFYSYERGKSKVLSAYDVIEVSFRDSITNALWKFDFDQIDVLVTGIKAKSDVLYLQLESNSGDTWQRGDASVDADLVRTMQLDFADDEHPNRSLGTLTVGLSYENVRNRLWEQLATLVLSNFAKTLVASIVMMAIFDVLVARHLRSIAGALTPSFFADETPAIALKRRDAEKEDEIGQIVSGLNAAKESIHKAHRQLAATNEDLLDANREQAEFTYAISHDLKSPTNTIQMLLNEIEVTEQETLSEDSKECLDDAKQTAQRMRQLIDDILDYAQAIGESSDFDWIDLDLVVTDVLRDLAGEISSSGAQVTVEPLPKIFGSRLQMRLLFQNLISNAIKFVAPDEVPKIKVSAGAAPAKGKVLLSVQDSGIGIPEAFQEQVFGMFQKLHMHSSYSGSGLGLTLCKRIVSNHSGALTVSSAPGMGATFDIVLPEGRFGGKDQKTVVD